MALTVLRSLEIPEGESLSNAIDCRGTGRLVRIGTPDDWTPAPISFQVSPDGTDFRDLYHAQPTTGAWQPFEVVVSSIVPGSFLTLPTDSGASIGWLKIRSGTRAQPVDQAETRAFTLVFDNNPP